MNRVYVEKIVETNDFDDYQINRLESIGLINDKRKIGVHWESDDDENVTIGDKSDTIEITAIGELFCRFAY